MGVIVHHGAIAILTLVEAEHAPEAEYVAKLVRHPLAGSRLAAPPVLLTVDMEEEPPTAPITAAAAAPSPARPPQLAVTTVVPRIADSGEGETIAIIGAHPPQPVALR